MHWKQKWQPTPVFLPGESQGWGSLVGCRLWGRTESDTTEVSPWVGPGKPNLPLGLRGKAGGCARVTAGLPDSVQPHRWQPTRLPHPWDSPGKNTGVGCHFFLQCMKVKSESEVAQSCPTLCGPVDCSLPGSSIHGIFQARVLEWGAIAKALLYMDRCQIVVGRQGGDVLLGHLADVTP